MSEEFRAQYRAAYRVSRESAKKHPAATWTTVAGAILVAEVARHFLLAWYYVVILEVLLVGIPYRIWFGKSMRVALRPGEGIGRQTPRKS